MTDASRTAPGCLDAETLAALVDGRLDAAARARAESHLAECEDCYEAFVETVRLGDEVNVPATVALPSSPATRRPIGWMIAAIAAIAAVVALVIVARQGLFWARPIDQAVQELVASIGSERFTAARLSDAFPWGPPPSLTRAGTNAKRPIRVRQAALRLQALAAESRTGATLRAAGVGSLALGEIDEAIGSLEDSVRASPSNRDAHIDLAAALLERWRRSGTAIDATSALNETGLVLQQNDHDAVALFDQALALEALGLTARAIEAWRAYLAIDSASPWSKEAAEHLTRLQGELAQAESGATDIDTARPEELAQLARSRPLRLYQFLDRLLDRWSQRASNVDLHQGHLVGVALREASRDVLSADLTDVSVAAGRWPTARRTCLAQALSLRSRSLMAFEEARGLEALDHAQRALEAFRCAGAEALDMQVMAEQSSYSISRDPARLSALRALEKLAAQRRYWNVAARVRQFLGADAARDSRFSDALDQYRLALVALGQSGDAGVAGVVQAALAETLNEQGEFSLAWQSYRSALASLPLVDSYRGKHIVLVTAAVAAEEARLPASALVFADLLLDVASRANNAAGMTAAYLQRARARAAMSGPSAALGDLESAKAWQRAVSDQGLRSAYGAEVAWNEGFILQAAMPERAIASLEEAYQVYEQTHNNARLAEVLLARGHAQLRAGLPAEAARSWEHGIEVFEGQRLNIREEQLRIRRFSFLGDLYSALIQLQKAHPSEAFSTLERSRARTLVDFMTRGQSVPTLTPPHLTDWLPPRSTVLAYAVLDDALLLFIARGDQVRLVERAISARQVDVLVRDYVNSIRDNRADASADALSALLIPADLQFASSDPVIILPDGPLYAVPFAAMPVGVAHRALVEQSLPLIAPSLTALKLTLDLTPRGTGQVVLVDASEGNSRRGLPPLAGARREIATLQTLYSDKRVLAGTAATRLAVLQSLGDAGLFHFAGHAVVDADFPFRSGLIVHMDAGQDLVTAADISGARLHRGMLVVLGACDTARGDVVRGEGAVTLARSFLAAGASGVVGTLWPVDDDATSTVLGEFHRQIKNGTRAFESLALSQRQQISQSRPPSVWAPFQIIGGIH